jgi:uncharacterized protein YdbL (DUF1318 family)
MKFKVFKTTFLFFIFGAFISAAFAFAGAEDLKSRFKARLPVIKALKAKGIVGENNMGYLELRNGSGENADVVNSENSDRREVYSAIAKQQGTTAEFVGKRRAVQIAEKADRGEWLQDQTGNWYRK